MPVTTRTADTAGSEPARARVVNIKRGEQYDVYIGRPGKGQRGPWGNPYRPADVGGRARSIELYRRWLWQQIVDGRITLEQLAALHGKRLGCFCAPAACHGDVLAAAAAWAYAQLRARKRGSCQRSTTAGPTRSRASHG